MYTEEVSMHDLHCLAARKRSVQLLYAKVWYTLWVTGSSHDVYLVCTCTTSVGTCCYLELDIGTPGRDMADAWCQGEMAVQ